MSDFLNMTPEELLAQKAQLGDDFQVHFPKVENPLQDPVSGVVAPRANVKGSMLDRLKLAAASKSAPKVRKGDFRVYQGSDITGSYRLIAPDPIVYFELACVEVSDGKKDSKSLVLSPDLFEQMFEIKPIDFENGASHDWHGKLSLRVFFLVFCHNNDAEMAIEINKPLREQHQGYYHNRFNAIAWMSRTWSYIKKVGSDPYTENDSGDGDGHFWETLPHETMTKDGVPPHTFTLTEETFEQAVAENLRVQRRYLEDIDNATVQEILGLKY